MGTTTARERPESPDGEAIGLRLARQDRHALEDAYAAYAPSVLAYARRYVGRDEAEDVVQRTFLDAWRNAGRYGSRPERTGGRRSTGSWPPPTSGLPWRSCPSTSGSSWR